MTKKKIEGPTSSGYICNGSPMCKYLDGWNNLGYSCYGECKKGVWKGTKQWDRGGDCKTPKSCPFLKILNSQQK